MSGVNSVRISQAGDLNDTEWAKVIKAEETLSHCNLFIETEHVSTPMDIYSRSRQIQGKHGLDLIVIDHMHLHPAVCRVGEGLQRRNGGVS